MQSKQLPLRGFVACVDRHAFVTSIHDRMPVIVAPANYERWLDTDSKSTPSPDLLQPYPAEEMEAWTVSDDVGNVRNSDPELLSLQEPGQGTLFS